jgi:hypothetical protein
MNVTNPVAAITPEKAGEIIEAVIVRGDLEKLTPKERAQFYTRTCQSLGLNPLTRPFEYIKLNNKLTLYARKDATDQLRKLYGVSVVDLQTSEREGVFIVTAKVQNGAGRTDVATGAVTIQGLKGDNLANAMMKAETKAKRRATLSICGLGFLDETEIETIPENAHERWGDEQARRLGNAIRARPEPKPAEPPVEPIPDLEPVDYGKYQKSE